MKEPIRKDTPLAVKAQRALEDCAAGDHTMRGGACLDCGKTDPTRPPKCAHPAKQSCQLCLERFCPDCDPHHREACREANRP